MHSKATQSLLALLQKRTALNVNLVHQESIASGIQNTKKIVYNDKHQLVTPSSRVAEGRPGVSSAVNSFLTCPTFSENSHCVFGDKVSITKKDDNEGLHPAPHASNADSRLAHKTPPLC